MINAAVRLLSGNGFNLGWIIISAFLIGLFYTQFIYVVYPFKKLFNKVFPFTSDVDRNNFPSGMVIVPSLLRDEYDLKEIIRAVDSCATNNYPGELHIIASADGRSENPTVYQKLVNWVNSCNYSKNIHLHTSYNEVRQGKLVAVYAAINYMKNLIKSGKLSSMPVVYFSVDADETVSNGSLQKLVEKLMTKHWLTGNYRKVVCGQVCINKGDMWKGWRSFFTIAGQNYLFVARNFFSFSAMQENINILPMPILLGQLYVSWSDMIITAPKFMGWLETIKYSDYIKWWFGKSLPKFSEYDGEEIPQALCGNTDDSSLAVFVAMSHWGKNGKLSWDPPPTPLHSFVRFIFDSFIERIQGFEQSAKVYTFTPPTLKSLFSQRKRWMACRVETSGRFFKGFLFYWSIAIPFYGDYLRCVYWSFHAVVFYMLLPFLAWHDKSVLDGLMFIYMITYTMQFLYLFMVWFFEEKKEQFTHLFLTAIFIPITHVFMFVFYSMTTFVGVCEDIFLNGCNVKFYPTRTLIASRAQRIAILYRIRRFVSCCWRSITKGDIPLGWFWISWYAKPEYNLTNGFTGWTKDHKSDYILR